MQTSKVIDILENLKEEINEKSIEVNELMLLFKDKKLPFKVLEERLNYVYYEITEDIDEIIKKQN